MAAAASSSSSSNPTPPWVILNRVAHVWEDADQEHREAALKLSCSPSLSTLSVATSVHPDRANYDRHPYIVAYDAGGLLIHISTSPSIGLNFHPNPAGSFVVVPLRGFIPAIDGEFVMPATAVQRVPERLIMPAVASIKNLGLLSRHGGRGIEYLVAELAEDTDGSASLFRFRSGSDAWVEEKLRCMGFNPRYTDEVVSHDGRLWWVSLGMGLLSCNPFQDHPLLVYEDLPNGVARRDNDRPEWAWKDMERRRCLTVSSGMLRFLELKCAETNADSGEMTVVMWTLVSDPEDGSMSWLREFRIDFGKILQDYLFKKSQFRLQMPVLAVVHPEKAELIYFFIGGRLFSLDVTVHRLLEVITLSGRSKSRVSSETSREWQ